MANKKETLTSSTEEKLISKISDFTSMNKNWIFIGLAAIVVILIAVVIITTAVNKKTESTYIRVAEYENSLVTMYTSVDETAVNEFLANVEKEIGGSSYPSVKSAYILGEYYAQKQDWEKAYDYFMKAYNLNNKIYVAILSEFNAAVAAENMNDLDKALSLYSEISQNESGILTARALFNVARIYFQKNNSELAKATLQQLIDTYPNSEYSALSKSFIETL